MTPEEHVERVRTICSLEQRFFLLTGFLVEWLRLHFSAPGSAEHDSLRGRFWKTVNPDIYINWALAWKPETTEKRPGLLVHRGDYTYSRLSIGDRVHGNPDLTGNQHYTILVRGSHTVFCVSSLPQEAEILGAEVARELGQFGPAIREELSLHRFTVAGVGKAAQLEEAHQNYGVPVTVGIAYEENWEIIPHAPVLKRIALSMFLPDGEALEWR